jgi:hypothetical protein
MDDDYLIRRYVPCEGLVHWPSLIMWTHGDKIRATEISEAEAIRLMKAGIGKLPNGLDTSSSRGQASTIPAPS